MYDAYTDYIVLLIIPRILRYLSLAVTASHDPNMQLSV